MAYDEAKVQSVMRKARNAITRAKKAKNWKKMAAAAQEALTAFETVGFPDCWSEFERARDDAQFEIQRLPSTSSTRWP